jgi:hypothetical protein
MQNYRYIHTFVCEKINSILFTHIGILIHMTLRVQVDAHNVHIRFNVWIIFIVLIRCTHSTFEIQVSNKNRILTFVIYCV